MLWCNITPHTLVRHFSFRNQKSTTKHSIVQVTYALSCPPSLVYVQTYQKTALKVQHSHLFHHSLSTLSPFALLSSLQPSPSLVLYSLNDDKYTERFINALNYTFFFLLTYSEAIMFLSYTFTKQPLSADHFYKVLYISYVPLFPQTKL